MSIIPARTSITNEHHSRAGVTDCRMLMAALSLLAEDHVETLRLHKTQESAAEWSANRALGDWADVIFALHGTAADVTSLESCGLQCHGVVVCADPALLGDQESTAGQYLLLLLEITATRAWPMSLNATCCPGMFAAVLHPTAAVSAMLHIKATYDIIKKAEALAIGPRPHMLKNTLIKVLDDVAFHRWQFVLEFWARAARSNWALTEELCYMAWSTNALVANTKYALEDKFSHLR